MFKDRWWSVKFIRRSFLWVFCVPILLAYIGTGLNEIVLARNGDKFPVMCNDARWFRRGQDIKLKLDKAIIAHNQDDEYSAELALAQYEHGFYDDYHVRMSKDTHWNWLADWIDTKEATISFGDVTIDLGNFLMQYIWYIWAVLMVCQVHLLYYRLSKKESNGDNASNAE